MNNLKYIPIEPNDEEEFEIFKAKSKCWNCKSNVEFITYHSQIDGYDNHLGSFPFVDEILLKKYPNHLVKRLSKTQNQVVISNLCSNCDNIQGNFFQGEIWRDQQFGHNSMEFLEVIKTKVSDILNNDRLGQLNEQEEEIFLEDNS